MDFFMTIIALIGALVLVWEARRDARQGMVELNAVLALLLCCAFARAWQLCWVLLILAAGWWAIFSLLALRGAAGWGDGPMVAFVCLALPFPWGLAALASAFVIGGVYGAWGLLIGRFSRRQALPFVPFLALGYWISLITWLAM